MKTPIENSKIDSPLRRTMLAGLCAGGGLGLAAASGLSLKTAAAQIPARQPFLLTIRVGSWDGWAAGLHQPRDVGVYPRGVFTQGSLEGAPHPSLNTHVKSGQLVFHYYNKFMARHARHLCFATGTPLSTDHRIASRIQGTGSVAQGADGRPSWIAGLAQASAQTAKDLRWIYDGGTFDPHLARSTNRVALARAGDLGAFHAGDAPGDALLTGNSELAAFLDIQKQVSEKLEKGLSLNANGVESYSLALAQLLRARIPDAQPNSALENDIRAALDVRRLVVMLTPTYQEIYYDLAQDMFGRHRGGEFRLRNALELSALLAKTGLGSGLSVRLDDEDFHGGGSSLYTVNSGAQLFAQLSVFWDWIVLNGLQDDVMVAVIQDFTRGPFNEFAETRRGPYLGDTNGFISTPGRHHHMAMAMVFLNGKVPPASRVGAIADDFVPTGSATLDGTPDVALAPYSSVALMGTMMQRCWPQIFPNAEAIRALWPDYTDNDIIAPLLA